MKILIVEDDVVSRQLIKKYLRLFGECDIAVNGKEAVLLFETALNEGKPYELITLDIMLPEMNGQEVLQEIRMIEEKKDILGTEGAKVIMTTALDDRKNIMKAFKSQCEAYLVKPIDRDILTKEIKSLGL